MKAVKARKAIIVSTDGIDTLRKLTQDLNRDRKQQAFHLCRPIEHGGLALGRTLEAELAIRALEMALNGRDWKAEELIHHSDRGVQYASCGYTENSSKARFRSA
jgi:transposase InsO family protein